MKHIHRVKYHGLAIDVCRCGASRRWAEDGRALQKPEPWHECERCTSEEEGANGH